MPPALQFVLGQFYNSVSQLGATLIGITNRKGVCMENITFYHSDVEKEYKRWLSQGVEEDRKIYECKIGVVDVVNAHFCVVDYFFEEKGDEHAVGGVGPKNWNGLVSTVTRQYRSFSGKDLWDTDFQKCASLVYGIIKNHPFHDCNKRTATLCMLYYMYQIGRTPSVKQKKIEKLMLDIASDKLTKYRKELRVQFKRDWQVNVVAQFLKKYTREIDRRFYQITFNDLSIVLGNFGYCLESPRKNCIDICKIEGSGTKRIGQIGFPGWTRKVAHKDMKIVRKITGLIPENEIDSEVFYKGALPMKLLVNDYSGVLGKLANR